MRPKVTIRPYVETDQEAVIELMRNLAASHLALYDRTRSPHEWGVEDIEDFKSETQKSNGVMLVAEMDGVVVGYCNLHTHRDTKGDQDEAFYQYAHIGDLSVAPQYRSQGIGTLLIEHCEQRVRAAGIKWMQLNVLAANKRGRKFYADHGFEEAHLVLEKSL